MNDPTLEKRVNDRIALEFGRTLLRAIVAESNLATVQQALREAQEAHKPEAAQG